MEGDEITECVVKFLENKGPPKIELKSLNESGDVQSSQNWEIERK